MGKAYSQTAWAPSKCLADSQPQEPVSQLRQKRPTHSYTIDEEIKKQNGNHGMPYVWNKPCKKGQANCLSLHKPFLSSHQAH